MIRRYLILGVSAAMLSSVPPAAFAAPDCPPGLAKKSPPCVPPGQAKKMPMPGATAPLPPGAKMPPPGAARIPPPPPLSGPDAQARTKAAPTARPAGAMPPPPARLARPLPSEAERARLLARARAQLGGRPASDLEDLRIRMPDGRPMGPMPLRGPAEAMALARIAPGDQIDPAAARLVEDPLSLGLIPPGTASWRYYHVDNVIVRAEPVDLKVLQIIAAEPER